jgi:hypothetical protein
MLRLFCMVAAVLIAGSSRAAMPGEVARFGMIELSAQAAREYESPLAEVSAEAVLTRPDGGRWAIPLFWDGDRTWRFRISPDLEGQWTWQINSTDAGLNGTRGGFRCVGSKLRGSIRPMEGFPRHFEYQDGTRFWFFGDTNWRLFCSHDEKKLNRDTVRHYIDVRARQGYNYIHADMLGYVARPSAVNEGGPAFLDKGQEKPNPAYFREADGRLRYLNDKGITCGLIFAWGQGDVSWPRFAGDEARLRYARYLTARYAAFNTVLIVAGEWQFMKDRKDLFRQMGQEVRRADPHGRMIAIHPGPGIESNGDLADEPWMSFAEYLQAYQVGGNREATDVDRDKLYRYVLQFRGKSAPLVNSEYAYFLRDQNFDGKVDKPNSHTRETFRRASWMMPMAGAYLVTGFGTTYFGGHRDAGIFDVDAERNRPAETDLEHLRRFFNALEWWRFSPDRTLAAAEKPGYAYCLADEGRAYVVYVSGAERATLDLGKAGPAGDWQVRRYDPREGRFQELPIVDGRAVIELALPDRQDWVFHIGRRAEAQRSGGQDTAGAAGR